MVAKRKAPAKSAPKKSTPRKRAPRPAPEDAPQETGWFTKGRDGFEKKAKLDKANEARREKWVPRFYLKSKAKAVNTKARPSEFGCRDDFARIVFLDSDGFFIHEHSIKVDGKWGNQFTCVKEHRPCAICTQKNDRAGFVGYFTVVDTRKWRKKDGEISKPRRMLFGAKGEALELLENIRKKRGNLRGLVIDTLRIGDKSPNCGSHFDVIGRTSDAKIIAKFGKDHSEAFDYMKVLAPPSEDELYDIGITGGGGAVGDEEDVDFDSEGGGEDTMSDEDVDGLLDD